MNPVFYVALAIGGSTLIGTGLGFLLSRVTDIWNDLVTAFAAGIMLAAAAFGLFVPALDLVSGAEILLIPAGAALGMLFLRAASRLSGRLGHGGGLLRQHPELMFVLAIAVHKFPEGMAGGVGLGGADLAAALTVAIAVSIQNFPEGIVMIPPLLAVGMRRGRVALIALATGLLNAAGVFAGYLWGASSEAVLPLALSFAGGAMLDVIISQLIPEITCKSRLKCGTLVAMGGFLLMAMVSAAF